MKKFYEKFKMDVKIFFCFALILTLILIPFSSAEITNSVINLTYIGNLEKEKAKDITLITEMPLTDETQKILNIQSDKNYSIERGNGKETIKINVGSASNYLLNFTVEKKIYEIKFNNENNNKINDSEIQNFLISKGNVEWDKEIKKKAEEIIYANENYTNSTNKNIDDAVKVFKIAKFVHDYLEYDYNSKILSARDVFMYKRTTCMGYTNLFIAMCRSVGIPTRAVGGVAYTKKGFERHAYAEVFINKQWIPIDPTFIQFPVDASHIAIYRDNEARGINVELKFIGRNVSHNGIMDAKFIKLKDENLISGRIINKNLTGKNSVMPINVELTNSKNFYVFGVCKISSKLNANADEKIFYLSPYEKKNITFNVFIPELEGNFLYFYKVNVRCNNLNLTTNFTVDTDKTGNIYNGVVIENINTYSKEIELKNLNEERNNEVIVKICIQNKNEGNEKNNAKCIDKEVVVEKGANYILKYDIEYPAQNFILNVRCIGKNFSDKKDVAVNVIDNKDSETGNTSDEISKWENFIKDNQNYLIAVIAIIIIALVIFIFKKR